MGHEAKRTDKDFAEEFVKLRSRAREHGLDPCEWAVHDFLRGLAEDRAEDVATIRHLYNIINAMTCRNSDEEKRNGN